MAKQIKSFTLPKLPNFRRVEFSDKDWVDELVVKLQYHHCDMNFFGMWIWDVEEKLMVSEYEGNVIFKFQDYETKKPYYSFLGKNKILETVKAILSLHEGAQLHLVPEDFIKDDISELQKFCKVEETPDYFDYVYSLKDLKNLKGGKYRTQRQMRYRFLELPKEKKFFHIDLNNQKHKEELSDLFEKWTKNKGISSIESYDEYKAFNRMLSCINKQNIIAFGVRIDGQIEGFIFYGTFEQWVYGYFGKANTNVKGLYEYLHSEAARKLFDLGLTYLNNEYDMGIKSLSFNKKSWRPIQMLKKYSIFT